MMNLLLSAPGWLLAVVVVGTSGIISFGLTAVVRRLIVKPGEHHNEVLGVLLSLAGVFGVVLVALAVFVVWDHQTSARQAAADQGAALISLYQEADSLPEPARTQVRESIRAYTASEAYDEFPQLARGEPSDRTGRRLGELNKIVHEKLGNTNAPYQMNDVVKNEYRLVLASDTGMPPLLWALLLGALVLMLLMAAPLFMEHAHHHAIGMVMLGCTLGAALLLILAADHPFAGPLQVRPTDLIQDLHMYDVIDGGSIHASPPSPR
jgi:hypothetical protein